MSSVLRGIILGDNFYENPRTAIGRANGAHRIATILRNKNIYTEVIDFFNSWTTDELKDFLNKFGKLDFVGLSIGLGVLDQDKVNWFLDFVKFNYPDSKIVAGGSRVLEKNYQNVDLFFRGFAEGAISEIINFLSIGKKNPFIVEKIKTHDIKEVIDCNKHFPNFHLSCLITKYKKTDFISKNETLTLEFSRGCIFKCSFCNFPLTGKNKNDYIRDKEDIKSEIIYNYNTYGTTRYLITDDTFNDNEIKVDILYEISKEIDFELYFVCYARVDLLYHKKGTLDKLYKSGVRGMFFGLESLTPDTSKIIHKGFTGDKLKNYLLEIKSNYPNLHITTSLIIGLPNETYSMVKDNVEWLLDNKISNSIPIYPLNIAVDNKINYISPFSKDYKQYGYEILTKDEVNFLLANNQDFIKYSRFIKDGLLNHEYPWKNSFMNFLDAKNYTENLLKSIKNRTTVSGWFGFAQGFDIESNNILLNNLFILKENFNWESQIKNTNKFVKNYINNKINANYC